VVHFEQNIPAIPGLCPDRAILVLSKYYAKWYVTKVLAIVKSMHASCHVRGDFGPVHFRTTLAIQFRQFHLLRFEFSGRTLPDIMVPQTYCANVFETS